MEKLYLMPGASNNGGEHSTWSVISCKASFAHTRSVVNNEGSNFFIHFLYIKKRGDSLNQMFCYCRVSRQAISWVATLSIKGLDTGCRNGAG